MAVGSEEGKGCLEIRHEVGGTDKERTEGGHPSRGKRRGRGGRSPQDWPRWRGGRKKASVCEIWLKDFSRTAWITVEVTTYAWPYQAPSTDSNVGASGIEDHRERRGGCSRPWRLRAGMTGDDVVVDGEAGVDKGRKGNWMTGQHQ